MRSNVGCGAMGRMPWTSPPSRTEQVNNNYKEQVAWQGEIKEK